MFGAQPSSGAAFGTPSSTPAFGTPSSTPAFGTPSSTPGFGTPSSTPAFGTPSSTPAFGTPSTPSFGSGFGTSLFSTPFSQQAQPQQQQQTPSLFQTPQPQPSSHFGFSTPFGAAAQAQPTPFNAPSSLPFANSQLTTQMAPVAPLPFSLADRDIQAIVEAYKEEHGNPKYAFKHLLFSVTEPQHRAKPAGVSDIMWAEAMGKLEGMESSNRERLWPQLVQCFKDLSSRLKLQDEVILSDSERLKMTRSNVKMLQRHFQVDTLPRIQRMQQKEQVLQRRLLRVMRIVEALEGKGFRLPLMKGEAELAEKLAAITRQLKGPGAELSRRVQNLLAISRVQAHGLDGGSLYLPGSTNIDEQSLADMQEVLQQQTEAISRLCNVMKRDFRDLEIIMAEDAQMVKE
ncbi:nuclear pore complex protein NUP54-like [Olea europaea var. sylvestris]|uniref:nuclear pore complex protein NUP54-like n=1 Tax=Olea europaea var. sylvestris TaxID=158386 RepID=UPI000C1D79F1|nr:nuclear pore complex protein NUP54-like [Olea europaea var. sylvestris]